MLRITPGPLPNDGTKIKVAEVLSAFVAGTEITNLGADEFAGGSVSFVVSSTEAPATSSRVPGSLWFKRGEGVLYKWEVFPTPVASLLTNTFAAPATSEAGWVAISNRRDMVVHYMSPVAPGEILKFQTSATNWKHVPATDGRHTLCVEATSASHPFVVDPILVAVDSGTSGSYKVAVEWGFCTALVTASGEAGLPCFLRKGGVHNRLDISSASTWTNTATIVGFLSESNATNGLHSAKVFLKPSITNLVH